MSWLPSKLKTAKPEPIKKTKVLEYNHSIPNNAGITTAAMWLIVKLTEAVAAISFLFAIFWKYVLIAMARAKNIGKGECVPAVISENSYNIQS